MNGLAGAVVWAVVPFVPDAPFRLYAGPRHAPVKVPQADKLIAAARRGADTELTFLVPAKARPVLVLSDRVDPRLNELLAVRLAPMSALDDHDQEAVRAGATPRCSLSRRGASTCPRRTRRHGGLLRRAGAERRLRRE